MINGIEFEQIVEDTLKKSFVIGTIIVIVAVILTVIITKSIVESSIKTPAERQQVIEQLTPHQKKVLGL